ncbi:MAG: O-antigen ligase family protein, partial [Romboutsia timonensis]|uniref:O-antigen ligase family protein n=1 Tax=Romboutsia timonensis TaxID=1776391 RepID=UPI002A74DBD9
MLNLFLFNSRTNTISSLSVSIIIINYYIFKSRYKVLYFTSVPIFLVGIVLKIKDYLAYYIIKFLKIDYFTSVVSSYKYGILDALTAGRIESYVYAIDYFVLNPILGTGFNAAYIISDPQSMTGVHNLWLRALFYGGMIYFVIFIILITQIMKIVFKFKIDNKLVVFMLIAGLINSLFEPFAPLGPGTSYLIYWSIICLNIDIKKMNLGRSVLNENIRYKCCDTN